MQKLCNATKRVYVHWRTRRDKAEKLSTDKIGTNPVAFTAQTFLFCGEIISRQSRCKNVIHCH